MAYCGPRGIPLSVFLSWSEDDQDAALAWQSDQAQRCPRCGTHPDEPAGDASKHICRGCARINEAQKSVLDEARPFTHIRLTPPPERP